MTIAAPHPTRVPTRLHTAAVAGLGSAQPELTMSQEEIWDAYFADAYAGNRLARRIWERSGVERRYGVAPPEEIRHLSTGARMERFVEEAVPLGAHALERCLADAALDPSDVGLLVVATSTGYSAPGLDVLIARELDLPPTLERLHLGHMGCHAALVALAAAGDAVAARGLVAVVASVELTSLHAQPITDEVEQIVANALFADGAAAAALVPDAAGLRLLDVAAANDVANAELVRWEITDLGFRMALSPELPALVEAQVGPLVRELLHRNGLEADDVARWAVHPGGPRIVDAAARSLRLDDEQLADSAAVLRECGHCSSATVLMVLERVARRELADGDHVVAVAVGPGMTVYAALFRNERG